MALALAGAGFRKRPWWRAFVWLGSWLRACNRRHKNSLRLRESLALGERRILAVVEFEGQRFLVGATASSMTLVARLPACSAGSEEADRCAS